MNNLIRFSAIFLVVATTALPFLPVAADDDSARMKEIDAYWTAVSQAVATGDSQGYAETFGTDAVFVSAISQTSHPIAEVLAKWKSGFEDTAEGKLQAKVEFRFSQRVGDATTAHESGIFHYSTKSKAGIETSAYIHFEALLVKKEARWLALMEYQKSVATMAQWQALASEPPEPKSDAEPPSKPAGL